MCISKKKVIKIKWTNDWKALFHQNTLTVFLLSFSACGIKLLCTPDMIHFMNSDKKCALSYPENVFCQFWSRGNVRAGESSYLSLKLKMPKQFRLVSPEREHPKSRWRHYDFVKMTSPWLRMFSSGRQQSGASLIVLLRNTRIWQTITIYHIVTSFIQSIDLDTNKVSICHWYSIFRTWIAVERSMESRSYLSVLGRKPGRYEHLSGNVQFLRIPILRCAFEAGQGMRWGRYMVPVRSIRIRARENPIAKVVDVNRRNMSDSV